jgi:hypothetical protein
MISPKVVLGPNAANYIKQAQDLPNCGCEGFDGLPTATPLGVLERTRTAEHVRTLVFDALDEDEVVQLAHLLSHIAPDPSHPVARYHAQMTATPQPEPHGDTLADADPPRRARRRIPSPS